MTTFIAKLDYRATLLLHGPDGRKFLQGQTTCDVDELSAGHSVCGAHCTPQGRMVCDFRLLHKDDDSVLMLLPEDTVEATLTSLGKYIVFSKATLQDDSARWVQFALWGDDLPERLGAPDASAGRSWARNGLLFALSDREDTVELCAPQAMADDLAGHLDLDLVATDAAVFRQREFTAGIGHVRGATAEMFLPQMLNMEHTDRISFTKGCYTGQEVIARLHYRGKGKRAMHIASLEPLPELAGIPPGTPLFRPGKAQPVGNVVDAEQSATQALVLAVITLDALDAPITLGEQGPELRFEPLSYADSA